MLKSIIDFYKVSEPAPCNEETLSEQKRRLKRLQWSTFLSATLGYGMYYVCRLSLNVVKKPIVDEGIFSETELGIIGSVLFFTYAIGKFTNGFLADRSNINRFMTTGLLVTALVNLCLGFVHSFILFAILWGISGWFQSMGAASCVVGLSRWFTDKERGSYYGFWSASHNIGEAMTFIIVASIVSALGWHYGFLGAGLVGLLGALIVWRFFHDTPQGTKPDNPKKTVYVMHMPPAGLRLGQLRYQDMDIGSADIYKFLKDMQPMLSLHGHIHESPDTEKGKWINRIIDTTCIQAGQTELGAEELIYATIDLDTKTYERKMAVVK